MAAPELYSEQLSIACTAEFTRTETDSFFSIENFYGYIGFNDQNAVYPVEADYLIRLQAIDPIDPEADFDEAKAPFYEAIGSPNLDVINTQLEAIYATITPTGGWSQAGDASLEYWVDHESERIIIDFTTGQFARQKFENSVLNE